jgi:glycosyltransferase involved in cell wall biosynthesis
MKVLQIINSSFVLSYFFGDQFNYFRTIDSKFEIFVACSDDQLLFKLEKEMGFKAIPIPITRDFSIFNDLKTFFYLVKFIKKNKIDIVISHTPKAGFIGMLAALICGIDNRVYFRHGFLFQTASGFKKKFLVIIEKLSGFIANKVVCVSNSVLQESLRSKLSSKEKTFIINNGSCNGIDICGKFNPNELKLSEINFLRSSLKLDSDDFVVGYVGRIVNDKGIEELIQAWISFKKNKKVKLLLIGPFEERDSISSRTINYIRSEKTIVHIDYTQNTEYFYALMNIFILPSKREGLPTVVLEASSMNLPVITTKVTGCIDSIIDNYTGIFVDLNQDSISMALNKYYLNSELIRSHGRNGRDFVLNNFEQKAYWNILYHTLYS